jgi:NAD+ synthase (glutamine-hydrolysing)
LDEFNVDPKTWYRFPILSAGYAEELKELDEY